MIMEQDIMKTIAIRTDADKMRGMGHLMRCIAIAEGIGALGHESLFIIRENAKAIQVLEQNQMRYEVLKTNVGEKEAELEELIALLQRFGIETLLLDAYDITERYLSCLHKVIRLVYMDDMNMFRYDVDALVNYTWKASAKQYEKHNYSNVEFLLGSRYIPVRNTFLVNRQEQIPQKVENVLLTTGGTDPEHIVMKLMKKWDFEKYPDIKLHVIVGQYYDNKDELEDMAKRYPQIQLYENVTNLAPIMSQCEAAISAGGTTIWELCTVGVPAIGIAFVENQKGIFPLGEDGMLAAAVDFMKDEEQALQQVLNNAVRLLEHADYRQGLIETIKLHADGLGARRIAEYLLK